MRDLPKVITRMKRIAALPPRVTRLSADELLCLHEELDRAADIAKRAANVLEQHIRGLQVPFSQSELLKTAYHEAGHVVANIFHKRPFKSVSMDSFIFESESQGRLSPGPLRCPEEKRLLDWQIDYTEEMPSPAEKTQLRQEAVALLAGPEAERRLVGEYNSDMELEANLSLDRLWEMLTGELKCSDFSDEVKVMKLSWALNLASTPKGRLRDDFPRFYPERWEDKHYNDGSPVPPLMAFLLSRSDRHIRFLNELAVEARQLVDTHWAQVERIAQALVENKRLTYGQCLKLFSHRPSRRQPNWKSLRQAAPSHLSEQASG